MIEIFREEPGHRAIKAGTAILPVTLMGGSFQGDGCLGKAFNKFPGDRECEGEGHPAPTPTPLDCQGLADGGQPAPNTHPTPAVEWIVEVLDRGVGKRGGPVHITTQTRRLRPSKERDWPTARSPLLAEALCLPPHPATFLGGSW